MYAIYIDVCPMKILHANDPGRVHVKYNSMATNSDVNCWRTF